MKFKEAVEKFSKDNELEFKSWYEKYINEIERKHQKGDIDEDGVVDEIASVFKKSNIFLKDPQKRDLKDELFLR